MRVPPDRAAVVHRHVQRPLGHEHNISHLSQESGLMLTFFVYVLVDVTWYLVLPLAAPFIGYRLARKKFGLSGIVG